MDFICSLFAFSMRSVSKFKLEDHIENLRKRDSGNGNGYALRKKKIFSFVENRRNIDLTFFLAAYILDICLVLLFFFLFIYPAAEAGSSPAAVSGAVILIYFFTVYFLCRMYASRIAERHSESIVYNNFRVIRVLSCVLAPAGFAVQYLDSFSKMLAGRKRAEQGPEEEVEEDIKESITEGVEDGVLEEDEKKMIESVLKFDDADVKEIMTPRTDIVAVPVSSSVHEAINVATESGYSRIPAYGKDIDDVKGVLYVKDILTFAGSREQNSADIESIIREAYFIPESKMISELFQEIREKKNHFAVVLDEYGGTSGIVTAEDIIEEIVGDIEDEYDAQPKDKITWISDNTAEVDARIDIGELNDLMDISLPDEEDFESLGGFLAFEMGKIPEVNETVCYDNVVFSIIRGTKRRILWVRVSKEEEPSE